MNNQGKLGETIKNINNMKKILLVVFAIASVCLLTGCKDQKNSSIEDTTSYSGYAPNAQQLVGKWFVGPSSYVEFMWNGSSWGVREGTVLKALLAGGGVSNLQYSGQIAYSQKDGYTATLKWNINYTYTSKVPHYESAGYQSHVYYTYEDRSEIDSGDVTLCFTSYQGGYCQGTIRGKYTSYTEFSLR